MATRIQLSLFKTPESLNVDTRGFSVPDEELVPPSPKAKTDATKKRDKRKAWYVQTCLKKDRAER